MTWADDLRSHGLRVVFAALDMREDRHGRWSPCPWCGATELGDRRHPVTIRRSDPTRATCHACGQGGDAIDAVGKDARAWGAALGLCAAGVVPFRPRERRAPPPPPPPKPYPVGAHAAWCACPRGLSRRVAGYLDQRGIHPGRVESIDLARPPGPSLPGWVPRGDLLLPMLDHRGRIRSLRARRISGRPKALGPAGKRAEGLLLCNPVGAAVLRYGAPARWRVVEGEPDFLACATLEPSLPLLGLPGWTWSSDWTRALRGPVLVDVHDDDAGRTYRDRLVAALGDRAVVATPPGCDLDELPAHLRVSTARTAA